DRERDSDQHDSQNPTDDIENENGGANACITVHHRSQPRNKDRQEDAGRRVFRRNRHPIHSLPVQRERLPFLGLLCGLVLLPVLRWWLLPDRVTLLSARSTPWRSLAWPRRWRPGGLLWRRSRRQLGPRRWRWRRRWLLRPRRPWRRGGWLWRGGLLARRGRGGGGGARGGGGGGAPPGVAPPPGGGGGAGGPSGDPLWPRRARPCAGGQTPP